MKINTLAILISCFCGMTNAQENIKNPFKELGYKPKIATLSQGKYNEFFDNDTIVQIGSILFNTQNNEIIGFIEIDTLYSEATLEPELVSRWLSPDPLEKEYPSLSPYNFVGNSPILFIDPDGRRIYNSAGAGHDADKTGYITKMINALTIYGKMTEIVDINAHGGSTADGLFATGVWSTQPYNKLGSYKKVIDKTYYAPYASGAIHTYKKVWQQKKLNYRIESNVNQIKQDLKKNPLKSDEQFNLMGYSTGAVINAQSALILADEGVVIDNVILVGATFSEKSALNKALENHKNIKNVIRVDIEGDNAAQGPLSVPSFIVKGDEHPHFKYAFNKDADENRKELAKSLKKQGVADKKTKAENQPSTTTGQ